MLCAPKLKIGDTIGIICSSHIYEPVRYSHAIATLERMGFRIRLGTNIEKTTDGYLASAEERAADLNEMVADNKVKMVLFGGGNGASELLPYIDYKNIQKNPKLFSSYSDGTSILNAIWAQTGLATYYGAGNGIFEDLQPFDWEHFEASFIHGVDSYRHHGKWETLREGKSEGILVGGYLSLFVHMLGNRYFPYNPTHRYIVFLETHEKFNSPAEAAGYFAFLEQTAFFEHVDALIVGTYAEKPPQSYLRRLWRFGEKRNIPVVYSDTFGHGLRHGIIPIGIRATLDTENKELRKIT